MMNYKLMLIPALLLLFTQCNEDLEKPAYQVVKKEGDIELRAYQEMPLVTAKMTNQDSSNRAFRQLFKYIDKGNSSEQKIAMTAPVIMTATANQGESDDQQGEMSFVIPAQVAKAGAPEPSSAQVQLDKIKAGKIAVIRFYKYDDSAAIAQATATLKQWIAQQGLKEAGEVKLAYYDPPWTPEKYRTNEIWIAVK